MGPICSKVRIWILKPPRLNKTKPNFYEPISLLDGKFLFPRRGRNNDKAHPPIHPIKAFTDDADVDTKKIYEFISRRFLACCSEDAKGHETNVEIEIAGELFSASGTWPMGIFYPYTFSHL